MADIARLYSEVFAPKYFLLLCTAVLVVHEWRATERDWPGLAGRFGVVALAWVVAFVVYEGGSAAFSIAHPAAEDLFAGLGLALGFLFIWVAWRVRGWGTQIRELAVVLLALTAVHSAIVLAWDVSSHVAYATTAGGYATVVDRRYVPLTLVPLGLVASRPLVGAHTWAQSVGGLVLGVAVLVGLAWYRSSTPTPRQESAEGERA